MEDVEDRRGWRDNVTGTGNREGRTKRRTGLMYHQALYPQVPYHPRTGLVPYEFGSLPG